MCPKIIEAHAHTPQYAVIGGIVVAFFLRYSLNLPVYVFAYVFVGNAVVDIVYFCRRYQP